MLITKMVAIYKDGTKKNIPCKMVSIKSAKRLVPRKKHLKELIITIK